MQILHNTVKLIYHMIFLRELSSDLEATRIEALRWIQSLILKYRNEVHFTSNSHVLEFGSEV
jgi:hypothetical protein